MAHVIDTRLIEAIHNEHTPIAGVPAGYNPIMDLVGDARIVLLGEASHGTHDFYRHRAEITQTGLGNFTLNLRDSVSALNALSQPRLERAIGVIYRPETERASHYFQASLLEQFDAIIHINETQALEPLERTAEWDSGDAPETYPFTT